MEDLRLYYITQDFLRRMSDRARDWDEAFISEQARAFARAHPDYPELVEILEGELHRRRLNALKNEIRSLPRAALEQRLKEVRALFRAGEITRDELEVIETVWRIRTGRSLSEEYVPEE